MLKNRLLALFACGFATGAAVHCDNASAQDQFITQPSSNSGNSDSGAASGQIGQPRRFITQHASTGSKSSAPEIQVSALPSPRSAGPILSTRAQDTSKNTASADAAFANRSNVKWVPRIESSFERIPAKRPPPPTQPSRAFVSKPTPGKLTSWSLLPADEPKNEGIKHALEPSPEPTHPTAPNNAAPNIAAPNSAAPNSAASNSRAPNTVARVATIQQNAPAASPAPSQTPQAPALTQPAEAQRRRELAALVSQQILDGNDSATQMPLGAVDNPEGWNSIGKRLAEHIRNCQALLARRAYFSAREEAKIAIAHLMQTIDLHEGSYDSEPNFVAAMTALREAQDFTDSGAAHGSQTVSVIIGAHSSDILNQYDVSEASPLAAAEYYRIAAADKLVTAAKNHPWASELYYTLGRVDHAEAESSSGTKQANLRWRAMTLYRAAVAINPKNAIALNQLGVIFLQMDRPRDASEALVEAVRLGTTPEAARNLMAASQKTGDANLVAWARQNASPTRPAQQPRPSVVQVPGQVFASMNSNTAVRRAPQTMPRLPAQQVGYQR